MGKVIKTVKEAFSVLLEVTVLGLYQGLMPHVERQRREASDEKKTYIDLVINFIGALMGRQQCSQILACRSGKSVGYRLPGAGVFMMMLRNNSPSLEDLV